MDGTIAYVKPDAIDHVLSILNAFCENISFTYEQEINGKISFLEKCPMKNCLESYNGETGRKPVERVNEHSGKDINSHTFKYSMATNHPTVTLDDLTVLSSDYCNRRFKRKVSESIFIKQNRPTLNKHDTSVPLKLFN